MSATEWYSRRDDRSRRYAGRVLPHDRTILLRVDADYARRYDGQVATIVAANLLSRMTPRVAVCLQNVEIIKPLPWAGANLGQFVIEVARAADPFGRFELRGPEPGDFILDLGPGASEASVHGSGWGAFVGPGQSMVRPSETNNPIGAALAVIVAASRLFALSLAPLDGPYAFDAYSWSNDAPARDLPFPKSFDLGELWCVGTGSVGTAALYFLTLATRNFSSVAFDMDRVKVENLDRSPIFTANDAESHALKASATAAYLRGVGVVNANAETDPLDLSPRWSHRQQNVPDLLISAANERDVRRVIEQSYPPLQIYGTTGSNWNFSIFRHIPFTDPCSCCVFPPGPSTARMTCAEGKVQSPETGEEVDAALPFLSFGAGLATASEVLKAQLPDYSASCNRTFFPGLPKRSRALSRSRCAFGRIACAQIATSRSMRG